MDVLIKEFCAFKFRKMLTEYKNIKDFLSFYLVFNQDGKRSSQYFNSSVL